MKKYFLMAVCVMALIGCTKEHGEEYWEEMNRETESYWNAEDMAGVWIDESEKDKPNAGYVEIHADGTYDSAYLLPIGASDMNSGKLLYRFKHKHIILFDNPRCRYEYYIEWMNKEHTRMKMRQSYNDEPIDEDIEPYTKYWIKVPAKPSGWVY